MTLAQYPPKVTLITLPSLDIAKRSVQTVDPGETISDLIDVALPGKSGTDLPRVVVGDIVVPPEMYMRVRPKAGAVVVVNIVPESLATFDPFTHGVRLMEAQRRVVGAMDNGAGKNGVTGHGVGGFAQLTTLQRDGIITTRILRRWPDEVGERIEPNCGTPELPTPH